MRYTVLSVAYPLTPVGRDAVGGSEQILTRLDRALTNAGHRSLVLAAKGSSVHGTLIASPRANGHLDDEVRRDAQVAHSQLLRETLSRYSVDMVHMHSLDFHRYIPNHNIPVLATLHLPVDWYPASVFNSVRPNFYFNCVSSSQERRCPVTPRLLATIGNGVDVEDLDLAPRKRSFALAMGRICPEKAFHGAIAAAHKAHVELVLAGQLLPLELHQRYFARSIRPLLDRHRRFIGPVGFRAKRRLLAQARCLLVTSEVAETSSLVAMEALASGTPIIAFPVGALPEIVEHGRTGYIVSSVSEMAKAIEKVKDLDPEDCRSAARTRFSSTVMVDRYFDAYRQILTRSASRNARQLA